MNLWVIKRNGVISQATEVQEWEISSDYITTEKTSFTLTEVLDYKIGDFVMAKYQHGGGLAYFGVIDSYESNTANEFKRLICNDIMTLANFEFPATKVSGSSFEDHAKKLLTTYMLLDKNKDISIIDIEVKSNTPHVYQPAETPTATNLMKYLINGFKKYNVVWSYDGFVEGRIKTSITAVKTTIQLKNNIQGFRDWDVSTTEIGKANANGLLIVDKAMTNSELPRVLSKWWLCSDNTVTSNENHSLIVKPTRSVISLYDLTDDDPNRLTYSEVADSVLKGSFYSHEIGVSANIDNELLKPSDLKTGTLVTLVHDGTTYNSVLTGFTINAGSEYMALRFGHIRSRLSELLE